jgi:hypothetical protein
MVDVPERKRDAQFEAERQASSPCRVTDTRALDIHDAIRVRVGDELKCSGAKDEQLKVV